MNAQKIRLETEVAEDGLILPWARHKDSIPTRTSPLESHAEKPDWTHWPSIVRWAAQLDPDSAEAAIIGRGAPIGPPLGLHIAPDEVRRGSLSPPEPGVLLTVVSGALDDHRRFVGPGHRLYASATYAHTHRHHWTDREHRDYWRAHLHLWPAKAGRSRDRESLAFAIANARACAMPLEEFIAAIGYMYDDLRDRNVLDLAERMHAELDAGPSGVRVPIVVTDEELDRMPLLTARQTLNARESAANVKVGDLAQDVVLRGAAAVGAWLQRPDVDASLQWADPPAVRRCVGPRAIRHPSSKRCIRRK